MRPIGRFLPSIGAYAPLRLRGGRALSVSQKADISPNSMGEFTPIWGKLLF